jgi:hypothetical protein
MDQADYATAGFAPLPIVEMLSRSDSSSDVNHAVLALCVPKTDALRTAALPRALPAQDTCEAGHLRNCTTNARCTDKGDTLSAAGCMMRSHGCLRGVLDTALAV